MSLTGYWTDWNLWRPLLESETSILIWVASFFALSTLGFTMVAIPYGATAGEITYEPKERSALMGFRMAFASLGILIGGAVIPQLAGGTREGHFCSTYDRTCDCYINLVFGLDYS